VLFRSMYARLTPLNFTSGEATDKLIAMLKSAQPPDETGLYNVFDDVGLRFFNRLKEARTKFLEAGARFVHLAGAGPTLFTLSEDGREAAQIQEKLHGMEQESYLAGF
jgi:4-diphosphocytidyl-2-C-methyl-D-erythritol kinase